MLAGNTEKRLFSRIECLVDLETTSLEGQAPPVYEVEASNLSLSGLGVKFEPGTVGLKAGQKVLITIYGFPAVRARVCWVGVNRAGLRFYDSLKAITDSWVGDVLAAQGAKIGQLLRAEEVGYRTPGDALALI